jgi:hypothetical protein
LLAADCERLRIFRTLFDTLAHSAARGRHR